MTLGGWLVLVTSIVVVTASVIFCYWRLLTLPASKDDSSPSLDDPPSAK